jgi:hypothetical protein
MPSVSESEGDRSEDRDDDGENTMGMLFGGDEMRIDRQKRQNDGRGKAMNKASG